MNNKDNELRTRKDFGVTESKKREYPPLPEKLTTTTVDAHCHLDIEDQDIFMSVEDALSKANINKSHLFSVTTTTIITITTTTSMKT